MAERVPRIHHQSAPAMGKRIQRYSLGNALLSLNCTTPKREMAIVVEEGKMQKIWVNDILHFNGVNAEEFLALPELRVLNSAQTSL